MPSPSEAAEDVALAKALSQSASEHAAAAAVRVAVLSFFCPIVFSFPGGRIQSDRLGVRLPTNGRVFVWGFRQIWMGQHKMYLWLMAVRSLTVPTTARSSPPSDRTTHHKNHSPKKRQTPSVTVSAPKAKLQKLGKALGTLEKIVKETDQKTNPKTDPKTDPATPHSIMHPWTRQLLHETRIPNHVVHAVIEPYYLDPPGSLTQENLANIAKHAEKVTEEVNRCVHVLFTVGRARDDRSPCNVSGVQPPPRRTIRRTIRPTQTYS
ncbi:MAG: hypothetical protein ABGY24_05040 [bacterium]